MNSIYLIVKIENKRRRILLSSILFITANGKNCKVHTRKNVYTVQSSLTKLFNQMPGNSMTRLGRSVVYNFDKLQGIRINELRIDKQCFPLPTAIYMKFMKHPETVFNHFQRKCNKKYRSLIKHGAAVWQPGRTAPICLPQIFPGTCFW